MTSQEIIFTCVQGLTREGVMRGEEYELFRISMCSGEVYVCEILRLCLEDKGNGGYECELDLVFNLDELGDSVAKALAQAMPKECITVDLNDIISVRVVEVGELTTPTILKRTQEEIEQEISRESGTYTQGAFEARLIKVVERMCGSLRINFADWDIDNALAQAMKSHSKLANIKALSDSYDRLYDVAAKMSVPLDAKYKHLYRVVKQ